VPMIRVRSVEPLRGHRLHVAFTDGSSGIADLSQHVRRSPFTALAEERVFRAVRVLRGAVRWPEGKVGITTLALHALVHEIAAPTSLVRARGDEPAVSLRELRREVGKTQDQVAAEAGLSQSALSHFEAAGDHRVSALRRYVAALGGELEVAAVIGGQRFPLQGV
jgi:hypothetical protein